VNRADCRDLVERLMNEEARTLAELETLLAREHQILLQSRQVEALEDACAARQICMGTLLRIQEERRALLRLLGLRAEPQGVGALLEYCGADAALHSSWARIADVATRCRELNDRNGALVQSRIRRVEGLLGILTSEAPRTRVYDRDGAVPMAAAPRLIAAEA
jgi:flagellar biosynthesis/type III secretory pathway chaperone